MYMWYEIITKHNKKSHMPGKNTTQLSLLQKVPTCSQVMHKQKNKYLTTTHGIPLESLRKYERSWTSCKSLQNVVKLLA